MKVYEAVGKRIVELCHERKISINALAHLAAMPPSTLKNIVYGVSKNPGITNIKILCDALDITLVEFFDCDVFNELEQEIE